MVFDCWETWKNWEYFINKNKYFFRFKVLRHHPDKRRGAGEDIREDDDYFTCITKAFEQVSSDFRFEKILRYITVFNQQSQTRRGWKITGKTGSF